MCDLGPRGFKGSGLGCIPGREKGVGMNMYMYMYMYKGDLHAYTDFMIQG